MFVAGRTNGLHGFTNSGSVNFPAASRSYDIWVVDPVGQQSWSRSLDTDPNSGLTSQQATSIGTTNNQFTQLGDRLYLVGGYTGNDTVDALTAIDLPGIIDWTQGGSGLASDHIRQAHDDMFRVTGGAMYEMGGQLHLVFGHDFQGGYRPGKVGIYTNQVRSFEVVDDGANLSFVNASASSPEDYYRRRDLNVFPVLKPDGAGGVTEGLVALAGVFTLDDGAWTVPVEIDEMGQPSMADPNAAGTFKQAMSQYHSAKLGMYSSAHGTMHELLFGGITVQYYDPVSEQFIQDDAAPNTSQVTAVSIDADGNYAQHLVGAFPYIEDSEGEFLRLGANAEFMVAAGVPRFDNGVIDFDALPAGENLLGHIVGGLAANADHVRTTPEAISVASDLVFEVLVTIEPGDFNRDGYVDLADYTVWRDAVGAVVANGTGADASGDGLVNGTDYTLWKEAFGITTAALVPSYVSTSVPEPSSLCGLLVAFGLLAATRRSRRCLRVRDA